MKCHSEQSEESLLLSYEPFAAENGGLSVSGYF
jgi:hypothetical protein